MGRNTAPAVILAALRLLECGDDQPMLALPPIAILLIKKNFTVHD